MYQLEAQRTKILCGPPLLSFAYKNFFIMWHYKSTDFGDNISMSQISGPVKLPG